MNINYVNPLGVGTAKSLPAKNLIGDYHRKTAAGREQRMIDRARQICQYEPEFALNEENGMIEIRDYSEENGESYFRENAGRADKIDMKKLVGLLNENHFYIVGLG